MMRIRDALRSRKVMKMVVFSRHACRALKFLLRMQSGMKKVHRLVMHTQRFLWVDWSVLFSGSGSGSGSLSSSLFDSVMLLIGGGGSCDGHDGWGEDRRDGWDGDRRDGWGGDDGGDDDGGDDDGGV